MREGTNPLTGDKQSFYHPDDHPNMPGWFKGIEQIIQERGLWPEAGLLAECPESKCPPNRDNCCCRSLLFKQPDFVSQKSELQEFVESHGHLCDFYPKYHCEMNFIEQYWGAAKLCFCRKSSKHWWHEKESTGLSGWCSHYTNLSVCLDFSCSNHCILKLLCDCVYRYANRSAWFIHAYGEGLTGAQAAWANKRYHSHHTLPLDMIREVKNSILPWGNLLCIIAKPYAEPKICPLI